MEFDLSDWIFEMSHKGQVNLVKHLKQSLRRRTNKATDLQSLSITPFSSILLFFFFFSFLHIFHGVRACASTVTVIQLTPGNLLHCPQQHDHASRPGKHFHSAAVGNSSYFRYDLLCEIEMILWCLSIILDHSIDYKAKVIKSSLHDCSHV